MIELPTPPPITESSHIHPPRMRRPAVLPVLSMLVTTLVGSLLPLLRTPGFYFWDDTAGAAVGQWQRVAESLLNGASPFLQLDMWRGGNLAAEAATGMWNPIMLALMVGTFPLDDVAVAMTISKVVLFLLTAGGVYLLARSYAAGPWLAAAAGAALSLSGWAIFMDGTSWVNGTAITAFTPWAWWALRRSWLRGFRPWSIALTVFTGYLVGSVGNPYGLLTLAVVYAAVAVEQIARGRARQLWWLFLIGLSTLLLIVIAYLPFVFTSAYGFRANSGIWNDEFLSVSLSNLLGMSMPTHHPYITMFGGKPMGFPGTYLAWFILPLVPWMRWTVLRSQWRELTSVLVFGTVFLAFALGPSQLGMFRWPARLVPFVYLATVLIFAIVATRGLHQDRRPIRFTASLALIIAGAWMAFSDVPGAWKWHALVTVAIIVGTALIVFWTGVTARGFAVMATGMVVFLIPQLALGSSNQNVADYQMPTSKSVMKEQFADRQDGAVVQIFDIQRLVTEHGTPERWDDLLAGNMPAVAGFESTSAYSGIGFTDFDGALCLTYNGGTCAGAWDALWSEPEGAHSALADLIRARYVVVENNYVERPETPDGWSLVDTTDVVSVYERDDHFEHPDGTISDWGAGVEVLADTRWGATGERARVSTGEADTEVTFARIAWPGYALRVDGTVLPTEIGPAGLLVAELPSGLEDAELELSFTPPGLYAGIVAAGAGLVLLVTLMLVARRRPSIYPID